MQGVKEWEEKNCEGKPSVGWVGGEQGLSRYLCQRGGPSGRDRGVGESSHQSTSDQSL